MHRSTYASTHIRSSNHSVYNGRKLNVFKKKCFALTCFQKGKRKEKRKIANIIRMLKHTSDTKSVYHYQYCFLSDALTCFPIISVIAIYMPNTRLSVTYCL